MASTLHPQSQKLPIKGSLKRAKITSALVILLMGVMSLAGFLFPDHIYFGNELIATYLPNDVINLVLGVPVLLGTIWLSNREKLVGLLLWPGAILYVFYNYLGYIIGIPLNLFSLAYAALVLLSAYVAINLINQIDRDAVKIQLSGKVYEKISGWFLVLFGILFIIRAISVFAGAWISQILLPLSEIGVTIADIIISILWVIGGITLLQQKALGYAGSLGLLFAASILFLGLIFFLLMQPFMTSEPFSFVDILIVAVMGLILSIPFILNLRGTLRAA